ncbi:MAG: hypothetical protein WBH36_17045 [Syntrophobacteria bacterium]
MRKHFQEVLAPGAAADDGDIRACTMLTFGRPGFGRGGVFFAVVLVDCRGLPLLLCTLAMAADSKGFGVFFYYIGKCSISQQ